MTSLPNVSDKYLIQQIAQGDLTAFDFLYKRHIRVVYNRVRYLVPETDVEDVTQDVFLAAFCSLGSFRGEAQFSTWLRTLTNHKVAEYYRRRNRKKETMQVDLDHAERQSDQNRASAQEDRIALQSALNNLSSQHREVILLRFAEGMQFNEIAKQLKKKTEATKSLFRRAMAALREELETEDEKCEKR
jgi:RNA polymerase sigma-70 factor (ECF subfamily)